MGNQNENGNGHHAYNPFATAVPMTLCMECSEPTLAGEVAPGVFETWPAICERCVDERRWALKEFPPRAALEAVEAHEPEWSPLPTGSLFATRFGIRPADPSKMRPVEFVFKPWIVRGKGNEIVGEEDVGKSTFSAHVAAGVTTGALPGVFEGQPKRVLFLGADEDDWDGITLPRLMAAGADLDLVDEFYSVDQDAVFNAEDHGTELGRLLTADYGLVVIEHVLDVLPAMRNYNDPAGIRRALRPMLRALAACEVASLWTRHVNKGEAKTFRQKAQGSAQFGAVARSCFLIAKHPEDPTMRVAMLGKANYVKDKVALAFTIASHTFTANGEFFDVGRVVDVEEAEVTMEDVLDSGRSSARARERDEKTQAVRGVVTDEPQSGRAVARAAGVALATAQRILEDLEAAGLVERASGGWVTHDPFPIGSGSLGHPGDDEPEDLSPTLPF